MAINKEKKGKSPVLPDKKKVVKKAAAPKKEKTLKKVVSKSVKKTTVKTSTKKTDSIKQIVDAVVEGMQEVKAKSITILNLKNIKSRVCDYYIICNADSRTQVNAIADSVEETVKKNTNERPYKTEGFQNAEWILIDYVTVVAHIFQTESRYFYNLEALWADAEITKIESN